MTLLRLQNREGGVTVSVPGRSRSKQVCVVGGYAGLPKFCLKAPSVDGIAKAAQALLVSNVFSASKDGFVTSRGYTSRTDALFFSGVGRTHAEAVFAEMLSS